MQSLAWLPQNIAERLPTPRLWRVNMAHSVNPQLSVAKREAQGVRGREQKKPIPNHKI